MKYKTGEFFLAIFEGRLVPELANLSVFVWVGTGLALGGHLGVLSSPTWLQSRSGDWLLVFVNRLDSIKSHPCRLQCSAVQCSAMQCSAVQCSAVQCRGRGTYLVDRQHGALGSSHPRTVSLNSAHYHKVGLIISYDTLGLSLGFWTSIGASNFEQL